MKNKSCNYSYIEYIRKVKQYGFVTLNILVEETERTWHLNSTKYSSITPMIDYHLNSRLNYKKVIYTNLYNLNFWD